MGNCFFFLSYPADEAADEGAILAVEAEDAAESGATLDMTPKEDSFFAVGNSLRMTLDFSRSRHYCCLLLSLHNSGVGLASLLELKTGGREGEGRGPSTDT